MYVTRMVDTCDFKTINYPNPVEGFAVLAKGATGRVCEVMWGGPEEMAEMITNGDTFMSYEEAVRYVEEETDGHVDF